MPSELNDSVWCTLGPSTIHGIGVVALRDIPKGTKLHLDDWARDPSRGVRLYTPDVIEGLLPEIQEIVRQRYPLVDEGSCFCSPHDDVHLIAFMNHSSEPNFDTKTGEANRDIRKGEEVTEDYRTFLSTPPTYTQG